MNAWDCCGATLDLSNVLHDEGGGRTLFGGCKFTRHSLQRSASFSPVECGEDKADPQISPSGIDVGVNVETSVDKKSLSSKIPIRINNLSSKRASVNKNLLSKSNSKKKSLPSKSSLKNKNSPSKSEKSENPVPPNKFCASCVPNNKNSAAKKESNKTINKESGRAHFKTTSFPFSEEDKEDSDKISVTTFVVEAEIPKPSKTCTIM